VEESLTQIADRTVPFRVAARWAGIDAGGRNKAHCPFPFEHDDGGREQAFRVYEDHGYCFAEQKYFTVTILLSLVWDVSREDAAQRALRDWGWRPAGYAHLWADATRKPEPDRDALRQALLVWCDGHCPDWDRRQLEQVPSDRLARCLGLLPHVHTEADCAKWLAACKRAMAPHLS
jgi:hypothetical protein